MDVLEELNWLELAPALHIDAQKCVDAQMDYFDTMWSRTGTYCRSYDEQLIYYNGYIIAIRSFGKHACFEDSDYVVTFDYNNSIDSIEYKKHPIVKRVTNKFIRLVPKTILVKGVKYARPVYIVRGEIGDRTCIPDCKLIEVTPEIENIFWIHDQHSTFRTRSGIFLEYRPSLASKDFLIRPVKRKKHAHIEVEGSIDSPLSSLPDPGNPFQAPKFLNDLLQK